MTDASVIFVDDDPHIRQAIAQTLTLEDLSIACFEDARSGLESISQDYEASCYVTTTCREWMAWKCSTGFAPWMKPSR